MIYTVGQQSSPLTLCGISANMKTWGRNTALPSATTWMHGSLPHVSTQPTVHSLRNNMDAWVPAININTADCSVQVLGAFLLYYFFCIDFPASSLPLLLYFASVKCIFLFFEDFALFLIFVYMEGHNVCLQVQVPTKATRGRKSP